MTWWEINSVDWALMGGVLLLFVAQVYWYSRYMAAPARRLKGKNRNGAISTQPSEDPHLPGVSVILSAHNEGANLADYLPALLSQDYPQYEVIVVDDGSEDNTHDIVEQWMLQSKRLRTTFVPKGARVGSTKKLALTLGAKAAQYEILLLTDADCVPESDQWIRQMVRPLQASPAEEGVGIVLGYGAYFQENSHVSRLVCYDTLFNGLHYLGAALCGHPYMGVGRNLAYRKELFFDSGGFTRLMTNRAGDDDLFVNHVANRANTSVVLSRESYTYSPGKQTLREWLQQKRRHLSVSPAYRAETKWRLVAEPLSRGLFYAAVIATIVCSVRTSHLIPLFVALGLFMVRWIMQTLILNVSARRMGQKPFLMASVLWFDITLPLVNLWMLAVPQRNRKW